MTRRSKMQRSAPRGFLTCQARDAAASTFPFEPASNRAYFFDTGIIVRGLLAAWRCSGEEETLDRAREAAASAGVRFSGRWRISSGHRVARQTAACRMSLAGRAGPGCYQLKSALAWHDIAQATGDQHAEKLYESMLGRSAQEPRGVPHSEP